MTRLANLVDFHTTQPLLSSLPIRCENHGKQQPLTTLTNHSENHTKTMSMPGIQTPQDRATYALAQARKHRHHKDCRCRMFQRNYCNAADALWQNAMNRELDLIPRPEDRKHDQPFHRPTDRTALQVPD